MKWIEKIFLTDNEIKTLSIYLVYGIGLGVLIGLFTSNVQLYFALGGTISILISLSKIYISRIKKSNKININKL